jgi:hypothetical protein
MPWSRALLVPFMVPFFFLQTIWEMFNTRPKSKEEHQAILDSLKPKRR